MATARILAGRWLAALLLMLFGALAAMQPASAQIVKTPHVTAELLSPTTTIEAGKPFTIGLRLKMIPHWHTYWVNAGDAGVKTEINWKLPAGFTAGAIQWPHPVRLPLGPVVNFGYNDEVTLLTQLTAPANVKPGDVIPLKAHATWLVCAEVCVPENGDVGIDLKVGTGTPAADPANAASFAKATAELPKASNKWTITAEETPEGYKLVGTPAAGAGPAPANLFFFSSDETVVESSAPQPMTKDGDKFVLTLTKAAFASEPSKRLNGDLVGDGGWGDGIQAIAVSTPVGAAGTATAGGGTAAAAKSGDAIGFTALLGTILLALMGGLILNLMPCVFPVLGLKIMGFAHQAGQDRRKVMLHGLVFTAGVLVSFWILAGILAVLRAGGDQLGWGFQLQSPVFVFVLAAVMLTFAMNMSGAFEFGVRATGVGQDLQYKSGLAGTFFTGFLATVVATPCSAPFLAPALGAAVVLPAVQSFIVFTAIGLGLSLPYLLLSIFPQAVKVLPKPGRWMETFKQIMAFPLYATVVYLFWVLAGQLTDEGILNAGWALVALAVGLWGYGRWTQPGAPRRGLATAVAMLLVFGGGAVWLGWPTPEAQLASGKQEIVWEKWSPEAVAKLQSENRIIYVDFTARWCATCQANKKLVFHSDDVVKQFKDKGIATLRADWTNYDPAITNELAKYGRSAIPFNLVYKPGQDKPAELPEVLTPGIVMKAIS